MVSTHGSVVPLAMFVHLLAPPGALYTIVYQYISDNWHFISNFEPVRVCAYNLVQEVGGPEVTLHF